MIVIIDSIDRVGKTTLANKIADSLGAKIYKHSEKNKDYSKMNDESETSAMLAMIDLYKLNPENKIIFDRFHLSNTVYGIINRDYDKTSAYENFVKIDDALAELDDVYLVKVDPTDITRSSKEHGSDLSRHKSMFDELYGLSNIKTKKTCTYLTMDDIVEFFKNI